MKVYEFGEENAKTFVMRRFCRMSEAGGASGFVRQYTLASGAPYCDCGYKKKVRG